MSQIPSVVLFTIQFVEKQNNLTLRALILLYSVLKAFEQGGFCKILTVPRVLWRGGGGGGFKKPVNGRLEMQKKGFL